MRWLWRKIGDFVWWNYPRGSVEYDIMVGLILAFLFLTPRHFFRDQPRPFHSASLSVTLLDSQKGHLYEIKGAGRHVDLAGVLSRRLGHAVEIRKIQGQPVPAESGGPRTFDYKVWTN